MCPVFWDRHVLLVSEEWIFLTKHLAMIFVVQNILLKLAMREYTFDMGAKGLT